MKESPIIETLENNEWDKCDKACKDLLQKMEHLNSQFQLREEREVVLNNDTNSSYCCYNLNDNIIEVGGFRKEDKPTILAGLYGVGFGIGVRDYYNNKSHLIALSNVDKTQLDDEYISSDLVHEKASEMGCGLHIPIDSYTSNLAKKESAYYLVDKVLNACETDKDCRNLANAYVTAYELIREQNNVRTMFKVLGKSFAGLKKYIESTNIRFDRLNKINTSKGIYDNINPDVVSFFDDNMVLYDLASISPAPISDFSGDFFTHNYFKKAIRKK